MDERRFRIGLQSGCIVHDAMGVMVKGNDARWRYWIEFDGRVVPGHGEFPPTRAGHARLKATAAEHFERLLWPTQRHGTPEDIQ